MAVGNYGYKSMMKHQDVDQHNKAELFYHSTESWQTKASYPYWESVSAFQIIFHRSDFILFGGLVSKNGQSFVIDIVAKFNPDLNKWTKLGKLGPGKVAINVIEIDNKFLLMGGQAYKSTETCELKNEKMICSAREPFTSIILHYPAMMIVASDYANNC